MWITIHLQYYNNPHTSNHRGWPFTPALLKTLTISSLKLWQSFIIGSEGNAVNNHRHTSDIEYDKISYLRFVAYSKFSICAYPNKDISYTLTEILAVL